MLRLNTEFQRLCLRGIETVSKSAWNHEHALEAFNRACQDLVNDDYLPITDVSMQTVVSNGSLLYVFTQQYAKSTMH